MLRWPLLRAAHLRLGRRGEDAAVRLLEHLGCRILCRNWRCAAGELDIVAVDGDILRFIEVKSLNRKAGFTPAVNLSAEQRRRNYRAARFFLRLSGKNVPDVRFDLIEAVFCRGRLVELRRHCDYIG